jgi:excisionase family DNA binding protein
VSFTENQRPAQKDLTEPVRSPYLTAQETVAYLRLGSLTALYRLIREHRLPYGRRGRAYLFDTRKLDRWVDSLGEVKPLSAVSRRSA